MSESCVLCGDPVNPFDTSTWKEVTGWVGGPKRDSMRLRQDTGRYAHNHCVNAAQQGQDPGQPNLLDEPAPELPEGIDSETKDLLGLGDG